MNIYTGFPVFDDMLSGNKLIMKLYMITYDNINNENMLQVKMFISSCLN